MGTAERRAFGGVYELERMCYDGRRERAVKSCGKMVVLLQGQTGKRKGYGRVHTTPHIQDILDNLRPGRASTR